MKQTPKALIWSVCICAFCVVLMAAVLLLYDGKEPPFVPPPFDDGAVCGIPTAAELQELETDAFCVSVGGKPVCDGQSAQVWFVNPRENTVWLKLRVLDAQGNLLGETGLIRPGEYLCSVALSAPLQKGTPIELKIMAYETDTYYSAGAVSLQTTAS